MTDYHIGISQSSKAQCIPISEDAYRFVFSFFFLLVDQILTRHYAEKLLLLRLCFRNAKECARKGKTAKNTR